MKQRELLAGRPGAARRPDFEFSERDDIELSFIRTLSVQGLVLGGAISAEDRRERIRLAIFNQRLDAAPFDKTMSFAQAYQFCYNRPLDLRRADRAVVPSPADVSVSGDEDVAFDDDDDDDESIGASRYSA